MNAIFYVTLIICGSVLLGILLALPIRKQLEQLQRYWNVEIGMPEEEMLDIMGEGYNRSFLKNNRVKYEWRINATSVGSSYKGTSFRSYFFFFINRLHRFFFFHNCRFFLFLCKRLQSQGRRRRRIRRHWRESRAPAARRGKGRCG